MFKNNARRQHPGVVLHATDSVDETRANLDALGIDYELVRSKAPARWSSFSDLFQSLRESGTKYVLARNFECKELLSTIPCRLDDVDIVAADCLKVAYALDPASGIPAPAELKMERSIIRRDTNIGSMPLRIDVRCLGSGYLDDKWLWSALRHRKFVNLTGGLYIMDPVHHVFSLLYHDLIQKKRRVLSTHWRMLKLRLQGLEIEDMARYTVIEKHLLVDIKAAVAAQQSSFAKRILVRFMEDHGYRRVDFPSRTAV